MPKEYSPFNPESVIICETMRRPMEAVTQVKASMFEGVPMSITTWHPENGSYLAFDYFSISADSWREIIPPLARFLGLQINDNVPTVKQISNQTTRPGRHTAVIPADTAPLVEAVRIAHTNGRPYHKTGLNGLHARRSELPEGFNGIGRDRLERVADGLLKSGAITQGDNGALAVPEIVTESGIRNQER